MSKASRRTYWSRRAIARTAEASVVAGVLGCIIVGFLLIEFTDGKLRTTSGWWIGAVMTAAVTAAVAAGAILVGIVMILLGYRRSSVGPTFGAAFGYFAGACLAISSWWAIDLVARYL